MASRNGAAGRQSHLARAAHRAVDDRIQLERAARIVRAALDRQKLTLDDLTPLPLPPETRASTKAAS